MPFPKNKRTTLVLFLAGVAIFLSLFYFFPSTTPFGSALRGKSLGFFAFLVAFGLAVFIHELGHFLAAKAFKVPVERFVIGFDREAMPMMPRCIWERKIGETTYGLSLMPLGGYVKMVGTVHPDIEAYLEGKDDKDKKDEEPEHSEETEGAVKENTLTGQAILDQAALYRKPFYQKVIIYSAGVIMNIFLAMVLLVVLNVHGITDRAPVPPRVAWQEPGSYLSTQGIQAGDLITEYGIEAVVDGKPIASVPKQPVSTTEDQENQMMALAEKLREADIDPEEVELTFNVAMTLSRDGETFERVLTIPDGTPEEEQKLPEFVGFHNMISTPAYVELVYFDTPAAKGGMKRGDLVKSINGEPIDDWQEMLYIVRNGLDQQLEFVVERGEQLVTLHITPHVSEYDKSQGQIGVQGGSPETVLVKMPLGEAVMRAPEMVWNSITRYLQQLGTLGKRLAHGEIQMVRRQLGGPVAIARMASYTANINLEYYIGFLIMFNIALAVINILPIPILDGGHIVLAAYEAVFRRPVPPKVLIPVLNGAFVVLITLFILITFSDLSKWIGLG